MVAPRPVGAARREQRAERAAQVAFVVGIAGLPVWWLLGLLEVVLLLIAVPMVADLWHRRRVLVPPRFGWWLLFLVWVALGAGVLWAAAPGAADDDGGSGRLLVFGYRLAWYVACTVVLVWLGNASRTRFPDRTVHRLIAWVFVVTVAGGLLGLLAPELRITTPVEMVLPGGLRSNSFVASLVSAEAADVQTVLGDPQPRPKAPFAFTNTWGSMFALSLVFFVAAAAGFRKRVRWVAVPVLAVALVPVVFSLNRGLWGALAAGCVGVLVLLAVRRQPLALVAVVALVLIGGTVASETPLGDTYAARLENPHSNERRSQLLTATVESVTSGSPVVGFGSTRDVQGSFSSIAGGATPECPACGVPPLGTQGQLWLVLFSQGVLGLMFFLVFFVLALTRTWRCRTTNETIATFVVACYLLQLVVYDTLGLPLMIAMVAIALVWREGLAEPGRSPSRAPALRRPRAAEVAVLACASILGAGVGALVSAGATTPVSSTVAVALTPTPTYLDIGSAARELKDGMTQSTEDPEPSTIDTEAALLRSERALVRAGRKVKMSPDRLRTSVALVAPPLSSILEVTVSTSDATDPRTVAVAVADSYLVERNRYLQRQRTDMIARLQQQLGAIDARDPSQQGVRSYLRAALDHLNTHRPEVGHVIRVGELDRVPTDPAVPVTTGLAFGVLLGLAALGAGTRMRRGRR